PDWSLETCQNKTLTPHGHCTKYSCGRRAVCHTSTLDHSTPRTTRWPCATHVTSTPVVTKEPQSGWSQPMQFRARILTPRAASLNPPRAKHSGTRPTTPNLKG